MTKTHEIKIVDLPPQGPSHGDVRVANAPLYNEIGKERIGRLDGLCVLTDPADEPNEKANMVECTYTYTLPGGEISLQGVNAYPKLPAPAPRSVDAISGGTGKYAGVRGTYSSNRVEVQLRRIYLPRLSDNSRKASHCGLPSEGRRGQKHRFGAIRATERGRSRVLQRFIRQSLYALG